MERLTVRDIYVHLAKFLCDREAKLLSVTCKTINAALEVYMKRRDIALRAKWIRDCVHFCARGGCFMHFTDFVTCGSMQIGRTTIIPYKYNIGVPGFLVNGVVYRCFDSAYETYMTIDGIVMAFYNAKLIRTTESICKTLETLERRINDLVIPPGYWLWLHYKVKAYVHNHGVGSL